MEKQSGDSGSSQSTEEGQSQKETGRERLQPLDGCKCVLDRAVAPPSGEMIYYCNQDASKLVSILIVVLFALCVFLCVFSPFACMCFRQGSPPRRKLHAPSAGVSSWGGRSSLGSFGILCQGLIAMVWSLCPGWVWSLWRNPLHPRAASSLSEASCEASCQTIYPTFFLCVCKNVGMGACVGVCVGTLVCG